MITPTRKTAELATRLASVTDELRLWREAADGDEQPLRRHHTQIEAIAGTLEELVRLVSAELEVVDSSDWIFERAPQIERKILDLHRLWDFFRGKLALRYVPCFHDALLIADDLAWACYEPAQRFIPEASRREPPLIHFSGWSAPHLVPRGAPFVAASLPDGGNRTVHFEELVEGIPIALIGLPWFEVAQVHDLPVIAHEVGHAVERDLGLEGGVEHLLTGVVAAQYRDAWLAWRPEVFADLYGVLALGPAYASTLVGLLAGHPRDVEGEWRTLGQWGAYPTRTLRVKLVSEALRVLDFECEAETHWSSWRQTYPKHNCAELEDDVAALASAILTSPLDELDRVGLTAILTFGTEEAKAATRTASRLNCCLQPKVTTIRPLVAGARLAYESPSQDYDMQSASAAARARAAEIQTSGPRTAGVADMPTPALRTQRDELAGRKLFALLTDKHP